MKDKTTLTALRTHFIHRLFQVRNISHGFVNVAGRPYVYGTVFYVLRLCFNRPAAI